MEPWHRLHRKSILHPHTGPQRSGFLSLCAFLVPVSPRERRQPGCCYGRHTGDWLISFPNRVWKLRANKSWICQTNPFITNTWRNQARLLNLPSLKKICLSTYSWPVLTIWSWSDHRAQSQPSPANQCFCEACEAQAPWQTKIQLPEITVESQNQEIYVENWKLHLNWCIKIRERSSLKRKIIFFVYFIPGTPVWVTDGVKQLQNPVFYPVIAAAIQRTCQCHKR